MNSQEYSFAQLASTNYIRIPNLQRAYAQGRNTDKAIEIRNNFITDLKKALDEEKPLSLDTVYGEMKNGTFTPLDGQQRLTTLFLLHLYLWCYQDTDTGNQLPEFLADNEGNPRFCYATRTASEDFCKYLIKKDFKECPSELLIKSQIDKNGNDTEGITQRIIKSDMEFQWTWHNDPTISSMLNMLDTIHNKFSPNKEKFGEYYRLLTEKNLITFWYQEIKGAIPADELYIRMNARGLVLTDFENFKAALFYFLNDNEDSPEEKKNELAKLVKSIKDNIDKDWLDAIWCFSAADSTIESKIPIAKVVDLRMLRLLHICILFQIMKEYIEKKEKKDKEISDLIKYFIANKQFDYYNLTQCSYFSGLNIDKKIALAGEICRIMDFTAKQIEENKSLNDSNKLLKELFLYDDTKKNSLSYDRILRFYARYYLFPETSEINRNSYRILKRLIQYSYITEFENFERALECLFLLNEKGKEFLDAFQINFSNSSNPGDFFYGKFFTHQTWEEYFKLRLKASNPAWTAPLEAADKVEEKNFFAGQYLFLMECLLESDIAEEKDEIKINTFKNELLANAEKTELIESFKQYFQLFNDIVTDKLPFKRNLLRKCLILKSLLKMKDEPERRLPYYPFTPEYAKKWQEHMQYEERNPGSMIIDSNAPDKLSWKRVLRVDMTNQQNDKPEYRSLIKSVLKQAVAETGDTAERLQKTIQKLLDQKYSFPNKKTESVCWLLQKWCQTENWEGYFTQGIRMGENGKVNLLAGEGARLYKNFQELHMMLIKPEIQAEHKEVNGDNNFGCLTIPTENPEKRILLDYCNGEIRGCITAEEYRNYLDWQYCSYNPEDPSEVLSLIQQLMSGKPNDGVLLN